MENGLKTMHKRIIVVRTSGSGKTTLARQIAEKRKIKHIELDALHWDANWTPAPEEELKFRLENAMNAAGQSWTMDGNYRRMRELTWSQADTVIWLDYPRWLVYWRIISRTVKRVFLRQKLWNNNRESFAASFLSKHSVIRWAFTTYDERKKLYSGIIESGEYPHITFLRFTSPQETEDWLNSLPIEP